MFPLVHAEERAQCVAFVAPQGWKEVRIHFLDGSTRKWGSISSFLLAQARLELDDLLVPHVPLLIGWCFCSIPVVGLASSPLPCLAGTVVHVAHAWERPVYNFISPSWGFGL